MTAADRRLAARARGGQDGASNSVKRYECLTFFSASTISGTALNRSATKP